MPYRRSQRQSVDLRPSRQNSTALILAMYIQKLTSPSTQGALRNSHNMSQSSTDQRQGIPRSVERVEGLQGFAEQFRTAHALCFGRPQPGKQSARMRCRIPHSIKVSPDLTTNQILTHAVEPSAYTLVCWPASSPRAEQLHYGELRLHNRGASRPERFPHR